MRGKLAALSALAIAVFSETLGAQPPPLPQPPPTQPQPVEAQPTQPQPTQPQPVEPQPTEPQPTEPQPTEPQPPAPQPTEPPPPAPQLPPPGWIPPGPPPDWANWNAAPPPLADGPYHPEVAVALSALATTIPMTAGFFLVAVSDRENGEDTQLLAGGLALVGIGAVFGPNIGHFYAGEIAHGLVFTGARLLAFGGSIGLGTAGILLVDDNEEASGAAVGLLGAALACVGLGLVIYDVVDAPEAARRANAEARRQPSVGNPGISNLRLGAGAGSLTLAGEF